MLGAPGESTELAFRREVRGHWFGWLAAQEEADPRLTKSKIDDILKHAQRVGIRRMSDLALSATFLGRRELHSNRIERARLCFDAALRLDPDLPEARWGRLSLALATRRFADVPAELSAAVRTTLVDVESRRIAVYRGWLLLAIAACGVAAALVVCLVIAHSRRFWHDLVETAARFAPGAERLLALALFFLPLLLTFDVVWWGLALAAALLGYATRPQQIATVVALALTLPLFPLLDAAAYGLSVAASPILRGAEALRESRYDQRVIDDLEAVKSSLPDDVDIRFLLGRLYQFLGQNDRAITEYSAGAQASPTDSRCLVNRGNIRFVDGDFGSAQEDYQEALKRSSRNVAARYDLALVYAETFRTVEAASTLQEARALDSRAVQKFQESQTLVKVVSMDFTPDDAMAKIERLERDTRTRRILGQYRGYEVTGGLKVPYLFGVLAAIGAAVGVDVWRRKGRGYASECQKCGRTFCRLCKPSGESDQLCSQCIHVYLRKDGVAIETKLQKVEEVRRRKWLGDKIRLAVNVALPGASAFIDSRVLMAGVSLALFFFGIAAALWRDTLVVSPRPSVLPELPGSILFGIVALVGWGLGQRAGRRG